MLLNINILSKSYLVLNLIEVHLIKNIYMALKVKSG